MIFITLFILVLVLRFVCLSYFILYFILTFTFVCRWFYLTFYSFTEQFYLIFMLNLSVIVTAQIYYDREIVAINVLSKSCTVLAFNFLFVIILSYAEFSQWSCTFLAFVLVCLVLILNTVSISQPAFDLE